MLKPRKRANLKQVASLCLLIFLISCEAVDSKPAAAAAAEAKSEKAKEDNGDKADDKKTSDKPKVKAIGLALCIFFFASVC